jgi:2-polyprenyl-6-hydroxyphenyl methylase / 3-demethylubiquinone-9 3-methyltransferase
VVTGRGAPVVGVRRANRPGWAPTGCASLGVVPVTDSRSPIRRPANDVGLYDDLAEHWWRPRGAFATLHWLARARASLVPPADRAGAVLVDLACGGGLLAPHLAGLGYRHVGVDLTASALRRASRHGVLAVRGDVRALPLASGCADVVVAGEVLEHVDDLSGTVAEACRVLRPGGVLVLDTLADTALSRFLAVTVGERVPGGPPPGVHDPALFVNRGRLVRECAGHGVRLRLRGLRPSLGDLVRWWGGRAEYVRMVPTRSTTVLFQGHGTKGAAMTGPGHGAEPRKGG